MNTDFIGFSFDGIHSNDLNILRVSDGDRYSEAMFPEIEDLTIDVPGRNGTYYYGTRYSKRNFEISIAFDSVTETQFRNIRRLFGQQKICPLIFDERPYKVYMAKVESPIELQYICFDEPMKEPFSQTNPEDPLPDGVRWVDNEGTREKEKIDPWVYTGGTQRIYKGEGTINFVCYFPYAKQQFKTLEEYGDYPNVDEWAESSGILPQSIYNHYQYDVYHELRDPAAAQESNESEAEESEEPTKSSKYTSRIYTYNPGDIDTTYYLFLPYNNNGELAPNMEDSVIRILTDGYEEMRIKPFSTDVVLPPDSNISVLTVENGVIIDTRGELIQGVLYDYITRTWKLTGNVYNKYIQSGKFGKIRHGDKFISRQQGIYMNFGPLGENPNITEVPTIFYNYLYY